MKIALHFEAEGGCDYKLMVIYVKCGFFYGKMRRHVFIEQPTQDERYGDKNLVRKLVKAMYETCDGRDFVQVTMTSLEMQSNMTQPSMYFHAAKKPLSWPTSTIFLCVGPEEKLMCLFGERSEMLETTKTTEG